ncbi:MAG: hypothetical protein P4L87_24235 [Formivibrio sp.]|nr:hypothetical protein [Formivibrio sp.]
MIVFSVLLLRMRLVVVALYATFAKIQIFAAWVATEVLARALILVSRVVHRNHQNLTNSHSLVVVVGVRSLVEFCDCVAAVLAWEVQAPA